MNNIMKLWHYLPDSEKCLSFVRLVESEVDCNEPMVAANAVCTVLWSVVRPLAVTFSMVARPREVPFLEYKIPVPIEDWHLLEVDVPAHVAIARWAGWVKDPSKYSEEEIPELTPQALANRLARAHYRNSFQKGMSLYWIPLSCTTHGHVFWSTRNPMPNWPGAQKRMLFGMCQTLPDLG